MVVERVGGNQRPLLDESATASSLSLSFLSLSSQSALPSTTRVATAAAARAAFRSSEIFRLMHILSSSFISQSFHTAPGVPGDDVDEGTLGSNNNNHQTLTLH